MISIIEGVGDEVVYCLGAAAVIMVLVLAWSSTSVSDHGLIRTAVLVIERPRIYIASLDRQRRAFVSGTATTFPGPDDPSSHTGAVPPEPGSSTGNTSVPTSVTFVPPGEENEQPRPQDETNDGAAKRGDGMSKPEEPRVGSDMRSVPDGAPDVHQTSEEKRETPTSETSDAGNAATTAGDVSQVPAPQTVDGNIRVRLKFLNDTQKLVEAQLADRLGNFKRQHFGEELGNNRVVRLIFNGQLLQRDQETLQFHGLHDNCVVHCHVSSTQTVSGSGSHHAYVPPVGHASTGGGAAPYNGPQAELDMGRLMLPLFGLILGLIWCCRLQYRQYFNATSTLALLCITGLFVVSVLALCMPERRAPGRAH